MRNESMSAPLATAWYMTDNVSWLGPPGRRPSLTARQPRGIGTLWPLWHTVNAPHARQKRLWHSVPDHGPTSELSTFASATWIPSTAPSWQIRLCQHEPSELMVCIRDAPVLHRGVSRWLLTSSGFGIREAPVLCRGASRWLLKETEKQRENSPAQGRGILYAKEPGVETNGKLPGTRPGHLFERGNGV